MGQEDLARLQEAVGRVVTSAGGNSGQAKTMLGRQLSGDRRLLVVAASAELSELGSEEHRRVPDDVTWAHGIVNDVLAQELPPDAPQWRRHTDIAQGLADVLAVAIKHYHHLR